MLSLLRQVPGPYEDTTCQMVVAYGRADHPHLETIRRFRDEVLADTAVGSRLITAYYRTAPVAKRLAATNRLTKAITLFSIALPSYAISRIGLGISGILPDQ